MIHEESFEKRQEVFSNKQQLLKIQRFNSRRISSASSSYREHSDFRYLRRFFAVIPAVKVVKLQLRDISGCLAPIFRPASRPVGLHNARKLVLANLILFAALRFRRVTGLMSDGKANREIPEQCLHR